MKNCCGIIPPTSVVSTKCDERVLKNLVKEIKFSHHDYDGDLSLLFKALKGDTSLTVSLTKLEGDLFNYHCLVSSVRLHKSIGFRVCIQ